MARIYYVEGEHWFVAGVSRSAHATRDLADTEAAKLVNMLRDDMDLPKTATPNNWQRRLESARNARVRQMGVRDVDSLGCADANVQVIELELQS